MKKNKLLFLVLLFSSNLFAQDLHFSQFNQTPSLVNPALTGASAVLRASVIYKDQWRSVTVPYTTYGASFEMKFKASNWDKADLHSTMKFKKAFSRMAAGLSFFNDKAGDGNMGSTQVNLSLATFIPLGNNSSLSLGLQGSLVQRKIDFSKLVFSGQFNGTTYDPTMATNENYGAQNFLYPDFAGGVLWSYGYNEKAIGANNEFKANAGVSIYHFSSPKFKYLSATSERLTAKIIFHGDFLIGIPNSNLAIAPSYMLQFQDPAQELVVGTMLKYYFKEDSKYTGFVKRSAFGIGGYYRNKDAMVLTAQVEIEQYTVGFAYDMNTSKLTKATSGRGGPEIFIRFVSPNPFLYQKSKARFN